MKNIPRSVESAHGRGFFDNEDKLNKFLYLLAPYIPVLLEYLADLQTRKFRVSYPNRNFSLSGLLNKVITRVDGEEVDAKVLSLLEDLRYFLTAPDYQFYGECLLDVLANPESYQNKDILIGVINSSISEKQKLLEDNLYNEVRTNLDSVKKNILEFRSFLGYSTIRSTNSTELGLNSQMDHLLAAVIIGITYDELPKRLQSLILGIPAKVKRKLMTNRSFYLEKELYQALLDSYKLFSTPPAPSVVLL
jgi:hypothetical protein